MLKPGAPDLPRRVFGPVARGYDRPAQVLSLFRYRAWHRFVVSRLRLPPGSRVLDMATGTGALADELRSRGFEVTGGDITRAMLLEARRTRAQTPDLVECSAETPPFREGSFDGLTFGYLLRYVASVPTTLRALGTLVRRGGVMASLDFAVPEGAWYPLWRVYTDGLLPVGGLAFSRDWRRVGSFLGPSIREFYREWPEERLLGGWRDVGFRDVRSRRLTLGGALVIWGTKE